MLPYFPMLLEASWLTCVTPGQLPEMTAWLHRSMLPDMDRNTMMVSLVEALLCFAVAIVVVLRLDRLWLRLRELQLCVGKSFKVYLRFFRPDEPPHRGFNIGGTSLLLRGDQLAVDWLIITHPDEDHQILIAPHHGSR
jgi:hypothetical protein